MLTDPVQIGEALVTRAHSLPSGFILHTAGPQLERGAEPTPKDITDLRSAYVNCLDLAQVCAHRTNGASLCAEPFDPRRHSGQSPPSPSLASRPACSPSQAIRLLALPSNRRLTGSAPTRTRPCALFLCSSLPPTRRTTLPPSPPSFPRCRPHFPYSATFRYRIAYETGS